MTDIEYNEFWQRLSREAFVNMLKAGIHNSMPEPFASNYCRQLDDVKAVGELLEYIGKQMQKG